MKNITKLDDKLCGIQFDNKTILGLLNSLTDTFDIICSPIEGVKSFSEEKRNLVFYELTRDKNSIDSLLFSLNHFIKEQDKMLNDVYDEFINKELAAERKEGAEHE